MVIVTSEKPILRMRLKLKLWGGCGDGAFGLYGTQLAFAKFIVCIPTTTKNKTAMATVNVNTFSIANIVF